MRRRQRRLVNHSINAQFHVNGTVAKRRKTVGYRRNCNGK